MDSILTSISRLFITSVPKKKGSLCSINGKKYELQIHKTINKCYINNEKFNKQLEKDLGGCSSSNDLSFIYLNKEYGIEVKKKGSPDWMQCKLIRNDNKWDYSNKSKIPKESSKVIVELINNYEKRTNSKLYNGQIPPFLERNITYKEWKDIKLNNSIWNDKYISIPKDTINKVYSSKQCKYIQISDYGLYYLDEDICNFNVPKFDIEQRIRIRIKVHKTKTSKGWCSLSIMAACQPINIKKLIKSPYSLDNKDLLPPILIYK